MRGKDWRKPQSEQQAPGNPCSGPGVAAVSAKFLFYGKPGRALLKKKWGTDTEGQILSAAIYTKCPEYVQPLGQKADQWLPGGWRVGGGQVSEPGAQGFPARPKR